jgi:hypothetical protein
MKGKMLVTSAATGFSPLRNDFSTGLIVLMGMVGLVLLIASTNVANLLIARAFMRFQGTRLGARRLRPRLIILDWSAIPSGWRPSPDRVRIYLTRETCCSGSGISG